MPALLPVNHVIRVRILGAFDDTTWQNIHHVSYTGSDINDGDLITFLTAFMTAWEGRFMPLQTAGSSTTEATAEDLTSNTAPVADSVHSQAGSAGGGGNALGAQCAQCVSWSIA